MIIYCTFLEGWIDYLQNTVSALFQDSNQLKELALQTICVSLFSQNFALAICYHCLDQNCTKQTFRNRWSITYNNFFSTTFCIVLLKYTSNLTKVNLREYFGTLNKKKLIKHQNANKTSKRLTLVWLKLFFDFSQLLFQCLLLALGCTVLADYGGQVRAQSVGLFFVVLLADALTGCLKRRNIC